jgi:DNA repair exonuclease SbcCD nuclease subunit
MPKTHVLGDPHLGRSFVHGVPLARKGEREQLIREQFVNEYYQFPEDTELHVCMGDLFDKAIVPYDVILFAAHVVNEAARNNPHIQFVILKGNHDLLRDLEKASAFDLFERLITQDNVHIITKPTILMGQAFFAYDPLTPIADLVTDAIVGCEAAWFHADTNGFGSEHNVIPTHKLALHGVLRAYTGHVHKPARFTRDGVDVTVTGSMQPYAFGEQANPDLYVEHTLASLKTAGDLTHKVVRLTLDPGEMLEDEVDCLQLVVRRTTADAEEAPVVTMGDFDMEALFRRAFTEAGVNSAVTDSLLGSYNERRLHSSD